MKFMKPKIIGFLMALSCLMLTIPLSAQSESYPTLETKTKTVAIFKNGLGFFVREGVASPRNGWVETSFIPKAALGTFWIGTSDKNTYLNEAVGFISEREKKVTAITMDELLVANIGKEVTLTLGDKTIKGKIYSIGEQRALTNYNYDAYRSVQNPTFTFLDPTILILETQNGYEAIYKSHVTKITFPTKYVTEYSIKESVKGMRLNFNSKLKSFKVYFSYLQKGIAWMPSYLLELGKNKTANMVMSAVVINDAEDLEKVDFSFVVGFPNYLYSEVVSPISMEQSLAQFISSLGGGQNYNVRYNAMANIMSQQVMNERYRGDIADDAIDYSTTINTEGSAVGDMFFYSMKGVSLKMGERAYYTLFSKEIKYEDIYEWTIPSISGVDLSGYKRTVPSKDSYIQVWHSVKLDNSTDYPWTTAPAFVMKDGYPMAQNNIKYTPKGAKFNLQLTLATDIKTDAKEYESERKRNINIKGYSHDLVTIKGELYIKNYKTDDISMEIINNVVGEVTKADLNGKITKLAEGLSGINFNSEIKWNINIKAGKEQTIPYEYKVYVRN